MQPWFWREILNLQILASGCEWISCLLGIILSPLAIVTQGQKASLPTSCPLVNGPSWMGIPPTGVGSKGWHKSEGSALGLDEASRPRRSWLRRCLLRETGRNLNASLLNFYIFNVLSPRYISFTVWSKLLDLSECQVCNLLKLKTLFSLRVLVMICEVRCRVQLVIHRCHLPS